MVSVLPSRLPVRLLMKHMPIVLMSRVLVSRVLMSRVDMRRVCIELVRGCNRMPVTACAVKHAGNWRDCASHAGQYRCSDLESA